MRVVVIDSFTTPPSRADQMKTQHNFNQKLQCTLYIVCILAVCNVKIHITISFVLKS